MAKEFNIYGYTITPESEFVNPASNPIGARLEIIKILEKGLEPESRKEFAKKVLALNLSELGIKSGVEFNGNLPDGKFEGLYSDMNNSISIVANNINDPNKLYMLLSVLAHETRHKFQHEVNKTAKYFSPNQDKMSVGYHSILRDIAILIGEKHNKGLYYLLNGSEKDAFIYGFDFAEGLLEDSLRSSTKLYNSQTIKYLGEQLKKANTTKRADLSNIKYREADFIANHLPKFYENCSTSFNNYFSVVKSFNARRPLNNVQKEYMNRLKEIPEILEQTYATAIMTSASILAYLPKREYVKEFIDFAMSARDNGVARESMSLLTSFGVPLTKNDMTRMFVCSDMYRGKNSHFDLDFNTLAKLDEEFLVKNLVLSQGYDIAIQVIDNLKEVNSVLDIDINKVENCLARYNNSPILVYNGIKFRGCSQVLDYATSALVKSGKIDGNNFYEVKGELSQNLANIISHCENSSATNEEFNLYLEQFIKDPFTKQFEEPEEHYDEVSKVLSPEVAEKSAEFIGKVREQDTQENPEETDYEPQTIDGDYYINGIANALTEIANAIKEIAEILNRDEFKKAIVKLCRENSNGERVLNEDEILEGYDIKAKDKEGTVADEEGFILENNNLISQEVIQEDSSYTDKTDSAISIEDKTEIKVTPKPEGGAVPPVQEN